MNSPCYQIFFGWCSLSKIFLLEAWWSLNFKIVSYKCKMVLHEPQLLRLVRSCIFEFLLECNLLCVLNILVCRESGCSCNTLLLQFPRLGLEFFFRCRRSIQFHCLGKDKIEFHWWNICELHKRRRIPFVFPSQNTDNCCQVSPLHQVKIFY